MTAANLNGNMATQAKNTSLKNTTDVVEIPSAKLTFSTTLSYGI